MSDQPQVTIFTDGAAVPNPGEGGWAAILRFGTLEKELSGYELETTNNRMELTAAVRALEALKRPCTVQLYTDSEYLQRGISEWLAGWQARGWRTASKQPVKNQDLWQTLADLIEQHEVTFHWVKGHTGHAENERCDQLAMQAIQTGKREK